MTTTGRERPRARMNTNPRDPQDPRCPRARHVTGLGARHRPILTPEQGSTDAVTDRSTTPATSARGRTSPTPRRGSGRDNAASNTPSAGSSAGWVTCRRATTGSCDQPGGEIGVTGTLFAPLCSDAYGQRDEPSNDRRGEDSDSAELGSGEGIRHRSILCSRDTRRRRNTPTCRPQILRPHPVSWTVHGIVCVNEHVATLRADHAGRVRLCDPPCRSLPARSTRASGPGGPNDFLPSEHTIPTRANDPRHP
jgi:hypothetical protein